jgi:hypothetical protein
MKRRIAASLLALLVAAACAVILQSLVGDGDKAEIDETSNVVAKEITLAEVKARYGNGDKVVAEHLTTQAV